MINVLVTGGNGQLAQCIKDLESQYNNLNFIYTDYLELDICDLDQIKAFFKARGNNFQYCINCAAYTAVDNAESETEKAFQINANGPENLALVCLENNTTLIHTSTDFVFDGNQTIPYTEKDMTNPLSVYGLSKLKGEEAIVDTLDNYFIFRTAWLYSEHGNNFMKTMLRLVETRKELSIVCDQIGTPTYAKDLAQVILKLIEDNEKSYGTYHYSNEGEISWYDFAQAIFEIKGLSIKINPIKTEAYPTPAERPRYSVFDKTKIKDIFKIDVPNWRNSLEKALLKTD